METVSTVKQYLVTTPLLLIVDFVWLSFIAKGFYFKNLGYLMPSNINLIPAFLFYLIYGLGIVVLVLTPSIKDNSILHAVLFGALLGFVSYSTYDLTNLSTIKNWPLLLTIIDILWGMTLTAATSGISFLIIKKLF